jgi:hypothetical protein
MLKLQQLKNHQMSQAAVESNESDEIIIKSYIGPSSKGPGKGVKMSAEFYKFATDKIKIRKSSSKRKYEGQNKANARSSSFKTKSKN